MYCCVAITVECKSTCHVWNRYRVAFVSVDQKDNCIKIFPVEAESNDARSVDSLTTRVCLLALFIATEMKISVSSDKPRRD